MSAWLTFAITNATPATAAPTYVTCATPPWGENTNEAAMDSVFGAGNWTAAQFATVNRAVLFSASTNFIFLEGGDDCATDFATFLTANGAALNNWVNVGGRAILNAAPNVGGNINLGFGVTLVNSSLSATATVAVPGHPIFNGPFAPVGSSFTGTWFAHATVGPGTVLINGDAPGPVLIEQTVGSGRVLFGGMSTTNFHDPQPQATNLRRNMLSYMSIPLPPPVTGAINLPFVQMMLLLVFFTGFAWRRMSVLHSSHVNG